MTPDTERKSHAWTFIMRDWLDPWELVWHCHDCAEEVPLGQLDFNRRDCTGEGR